MIVAWIRRLQSEMVSSSVCYVFIVHVCPVESAQGLFWKLTRCSVIVIVWLPAWLDMLRAADVASVLFQEKWTLGGFSEAWGWKPKVLRCTFVTFHICCFKDIWSFIRGTFHNLEIRGSSEFRCSSARLMVTSYWDSSVYTVKLFCAWDRKKSYLIQL